MANKILVLTIPFIIGVVVLVLGCVLGFVVFPNLLEDAIETSVVLTEDTLQWYRFKEIPFPFKCKVYFFTITNPNEVIKGAKPVVEEKGPYIWDETRTKKIKSVNQARVEYDELWSFKYNEEASKPHSDTDEILVVNAPMMAVLQNLEDLPLSLPIDIEILLGEIFVNTEIFINVKVKEYAFDGIKMCDPDRTQSPYSMLVCLSIMLMRQKLVKYNEDRSMMFSLFGYKTLADGPFTIHRGIDDINKLGLIDSYKGEEYTDFWAENKDGSKTCDKVEGRNNIFPPFIEEDTTFTVYSTDICRGGSLHYKGESVFNGVDGYRFQTDQFSFSLPEEDCVCIYKTKGLNATTTSEKHCFRQGVLDLNNCIGVPVILSFPHLMWAGEAYQQSVDGMDNTYDDNHNTIVDIEPYTGTPLQGAIRIQFNLVLRPVKVNGELVEFMKGINPSLFPVIWLEDSFALTDSLIDEINTQLLDQLVLLDAAQWTLIGLGIFIAVLTIGFCIYCHTKRK